MLRIERFINELMTSNCYVVWDDSSMRCLVIDPASEKSLREIDFIESNKLTLDYILLTHEHTDHTWGVNALLDAFPFAQVVCHKIAMQNMDMESSSYFQLYYDDKNYTYKVKQFDIVADVDDYVMDWNGSKLKFVYSPGHSMGSLCIHLNDWLFTGDTILQSKPYVNRRNGSKEALIESIKMILNKFDRQQLICPGHGELFRLKDYKIPYGISNEKNI